MKKQKGESGEVPLKEFIEEVNGLFKKLKIDFVIESYQFFSREPVFNLLDKKQQNEEIQPVEDLRDLKTGDYLFMGEVHTNEVECKIATIFFCGKEKHIIRDFSIEAGHLLSALKGPEDQVAKVQKEAVERIKTKEGELKNKFEAFLSVLRLSLRQVKKRGGES